jgi:hypothetical protein
MVRTDSAPGCYLKSTQSCSLVNNGDKKRPQEETTLLGYKLYFVAYIINDDVIVKIKFLVKSCIAEYYSVTTL